MSPLGLRSIKNAAFVTEYHVNETILLEQILSIPISRLLLPIHPCLVAFGACHACIIQDCLAPLLGAFGLMILRQVPV